MLAAVDLNAVRLNLHHHEISQSSPAHPESYPVLWRDVEVGLDDACQPQWQYDIMKPRV